MPEQNQLMSYFLGELSHSIKNIFVVNYGDDEDGQFLFSPKRKRTAIFSNGWKTLQEALYQYTEHSLAHIYLRACMSILEQCWTINKLLRYSYFCAMFMYDSAYWKNYLSQNGRLNEVIISFITYHVIILFSKAY